MRNRLEEVLAGQEDNYLLPFLWQRGEEETVIREEMARVHESGIRAVCVEARPHPVFYGPRWWRDMDIIMEEARARGMRVWLLDDDHFPTGHAAGKMVGAPEHLRRLFLREGHLDALGPQKNASFLIRPWFMDFFNPASAQGAVLVAAVAARRDPLNGALIGELVELSSLVENEILYWDIPDGSWRIFFIYTSPGGGSQNTKDYINPLVPESVRVLIDAVYEPFYERYQADFGHTFAGFFSDEPGFYNDPQTFDYESKPGKMGVPLPWRRDLLELLSASLGQDCRKYLPLLWQASGETTAAVRYAYMDLVSRLYGECFTEQIGSWCRAQQVEYIGHVLEDNGVHARLGSGAGHFFRALWGQDMSGIDVVLWQIVPGFDQGPFTMVACPGDGEFFHYGLAKLGSSLAHVDPKKRGRAMCELFGAYGWREGLKLMKWMTDHLISRGINIFVPHAFSQAEFPDPDCPPHMYARGKNPQYRYYQALNLYTNRTTHLLSGGQHIASAAVLYHAEAEWSGEAMPFHKPVKALAQHQIDCDVIPADVLIHSTTVSAGKLMTGVETYPALIVPSSQILPARLLKRLLELANAGLPLLFIDRLPAHSSEGSDAGPVLEQLSDHAGVKIVSLEGLAGQVTSMGVHEFELSESQPYLRSYHVRHPGMDVSMFFNEHPSQPVDTEVLLRGCSGALLAYDAFENRAVSLPARSEPGGLRFSLRLSPYQSILVLNGDAVQHVSAASQPAQGPFQALEIPGPWTVATATSEAYPAFTPWREIAGLSDLSRPGALPTFSGTFRYETHFTCPQPGQSAALDLGEVYETAQVWVNGRQAGLRICPPYRLEIGDLLRPGENQLVVEVTNTLVKEQRDFLSRFAAQEPSGLLGPVKVLLRL